MRVVVMAQEHGQVRRHIHLLDNRHHDLRAHPWAHDLSVVDRNLAVEGVVVRRHS